MDRQLRQSSERDESAGKGQANQATADTVVGRGLRIVIVEDNADSRRLLEILLKLDGHDVTPVSDGIQGYQAIVDRRPDVALVDIGLPGIDGYELARRVRTRLAGASVQLVALTGYGGSLDREAVFEAGFDEHLVKPIRPEEFARVLRKPR